MISAGGCKQAVASPLLETTIAGASHVIINVSGDITLMDASDAAEFVQELAGEDANIIFGAMYDDSRADEATITVIATGLHNVGGTSSKLKSRLEGVQRSGMVPPASSYDKQLHSNHTSHSPKVDLGAAPTTNGGTSLKRPKDGEGHADRNDEIRVHDVDLEGGGNLLEPDHILKHTKAVIETRRRIR